MFKSIADKLGSLFSKKNITPCPEDLIKEAIGIDDNDYEDENEDNMISEKETKLVYSSDNIQPGDIFIVKKYCGKSLVSSISFKRLADGKDIIHSEDDKPAIESDNGKQWVQNGYLHRDGNFAVINGSRTEFWFYGVLHNLSGPAVQEYGVNAQFWIDGQMVDQDYFHEAARMFLLKYPDGISKTMMENFKLGSPEEAEKTSSFYSDLLKEIES